MKQATLCFVVQDSSILLGFKKRGFGQGKYNGFGGKVEADESTEDAVIRELYEEAGIRVQKDSLVKAAELTFYFSAKEQWNQVVHVYLVRKWENAPMESEEMSPRWFAFSDIPYTQMWKDDSYWLPQILAGKKVQGTFTFAVDNETIQDYQLEDYPYI